MRFPSRASVFVTSAAISAGVLVGSAAAASAAGTPPTDPAPTAGQGVAQAEAAGVQIDPAAVLIMESAPLGSCLNDPIQLQCGTPPTAIVGTTSTSSTVDASGFTTTDYALIPSSSDSSSQTTATPDAAAPHCAIGAKVNLVSGGTRAHGEAEGSCDPPVTSQYVYVNLDSLWTSDNTWHLEDANGIGPYGPGGPHYTNAYFTCNQRTSLRQWKTIATGYGKVGSTWYAGQATQKDPFYCVG